MQKITISESGSFSVGRKQPKIPVLGGITAPFSDMHRAKLERLVREGFERIEAHMCSAEYSPWHASPCPALSPYEFQVLMAADAYLRSTA